MPRKRSRKVLYEVTREALKKGQSSGILEKARRRRAFIKKEDPDQSTKGVNQVKKLSRRPISRLRLKVLNLLSWFTLKRAAILFISIMAVYIFWPSGGNTEVPVNPESGSESVEIPIVTEENGGSESIERVKIETGGDETENPRPEPVEVAGPPKDHVIVIASHSDVDQLKPVADYFAKNGVKSEFMRYGGRMMLVTKESFLKPGDEFSRIDEAKAEIKRIGETYKPPSGFGSFTFNSVYAMNIERLTGDL